MLCVKIRLLFSRSRSQWRFKSLLNLYVSYIFCTTDLLATKGVLIYCECILTVALWLTLILPRKVTNFVLWVTIFAGSNYKTTSSVLDHLSHTAASFDTLGLGTVASTFYVCLVIWVQRKEELFFIWVKSWVYEDPESHSNAKSCVKNQDAGVYIHVRHRL